MLGFSDQRDIREGSSSRQHIRIVNLSNILHVFFSPPPPSALIAAKKRFKLALLKKRSEVAISTSIQQEIRFHISLPKKTGKDRICIPVTAFSVVSKTYPSHIQSSTALGNPYAQTEKHNLVLTYFIVLMKLHKWVLNLFWKNIPCTAPQETLTKKFPVSSRFWSSSLNIRWYQITSNKHFISRVVMTTNVLISKILHLFSTSEDEIWNIKSPIW